MCNCSKPLKKSDCQILRDFVNDPQKRFFIYHIFDDERGLKIAHVPKGENPNEIALQRNFINDDGLVEFYNVREHPCLYE